VSDTFLLGLALVLAAGICQGSFMLPSKWMPGWVWENYWLLFAITAYLICPWLLGLATVPHLLDVYRNVPAETLLVTLVFGVGWALGAVAFGLGVDAIGMALGFAIILGIAATAGTLVPLLVEGAPGFSVSRGMITGLALALMLAGVAVCSWAGKWKEGAARSSSQGSYRRGVLICVASGLLSACGNLGFAFGARISTEAQALGAREHLAANAIWALLAFPLFLMNACYSVYTMRRNGTGGNLTHRGTPRHYVLGALMGVLWLSGMALYGIGAGRMGKLGSSFGWAIMMSTMVLVSNGLGLATGEWRGAPGDSKRKLGLGILILVLAIATLGYANYFGSE
jgi:L-rhamnose-H+ transport protein